MMMMSNDDCQAAEDIVRRYFQGVNDKNATMIRSCFDTEATIRDVCALSDVLSVVDDEESQQQSLQGLGPGPVPAKQVPAETLVQRCFDFVQAHPDCHVQFYLEPTCLRQSHEHQQRSPDNDQDDHSSAWVFAHWYETGTWTGESSSLSSSSSSCALIPTQQPMYVEGQTRFRVVESRRRPDKKEWTIQELIVTRTFTEWEKALMLLQQQQQPQPE